jgi:hypothetical protein
LRGAAALAVSGLLSPRFGAMFADDATTLKDPVFALQNTSDEAA